MPCKSCNCSCRISSKISKLEMDLEILRDDRQDDKKIINNLINHLDTLTPQSIENNERLTELSQLHKSIIELQEVIESDNKIMLVNRKF